MATLYPNGYGSPPATLEEVFKRSSVQMLHPEYQRRLRALMIASGGKLGVGGAGRSTEQQKRVFLERHYQVGSGGCCGWDGRRWQLRKGMAHAAPPGRSFHENIVQGGAAAVDYVGDLKWFGEHCEAYGIEQATWGGENWHGQFTEFPHSVTQWKNAGSPPPITWKLPGGTPPPTPTPTPPTSSIPPKPSSALEGERMLIMKFGGTPTAGWGGWYSFDGGATRKAVTSMAHAATLVDLGALDAKTRQRVTDREWDGVSHTTSTATLDQYLTPYG